MKSSALPVKVSPAASAVPGRILAMDYGRRRIGLALSDELGLTAQPLTTLVRVNRRDDLRRLREIVRQHQVRRIVVGHPLHLDGTAGEMAQEAARFAARIGKSLGLPVDLMDERLTSWEAEQLHSEARPPAGRTGGGRRGSASSSRGRARRGGQHHRVRDHFAAAILLRDYLQSGRPPWRAGRG